MTKIYLVRHGETEANSSQRFWGKTDVALGTTGRWQAERLRVRLSAIGIDYLYCSQMKRAKTTAEIISSSRDIKTEYFLDLNEVDFGQMEGLNISEIGQRFPNVARQWAEHDPNLAYPGGESLAQLESRVAGFHKVLARHNSNERLLVVAHSGVFRSLICQLLGLEMKHRWMIRLDLASVSILEVSPEGAVISLLNDVSHLAGEWTASGN